MCNIPSFVKNYVQQRKDELLWSLTELCFCIDKSWIQKKALKGEMASLLRL